MTKIVDQFYQAIDNQNSPVQQYNLVKTVLDNYPLDKPLGKAALNICGVMADKNPALRLLAIGKDTIPDSKTEPSFESHVETIVEFCAYGLDLTELLKHSKLPNAKPQMRV